MEELRKTVSDVSELFTSKMEQFQQRLDNVSGTPSSQGNNLLATEFEAFKSSILFCLQNLQVQVEMLYKLQDDLEMRSRRKFLLLHGVMESKDESPSSIAKMLSVLLKCPDVSADSISRCHRLGIKRAAKTRPVLIKFRQHQLKEQVWSSKTHLKGTGITLSEFLTKSRHNLFMAARRQFGVSSCWTRDGNIFAIRSDGERHRISDKKDVDGAVASVPASASAQLPQPSQQSKDKGRKKVPTKDQ
ncbi:unnamed protein product [Leptosia nina]|uniref:Uncharacterized protein n=1 Tax=Leptosia nina TaxID=320188 RepID=A0AAV1JB00_9NEOP